MADLSYFVPASHLPFAKFKFHNSLIGSHGHLSCLRHNYESSSEDAWFSVEPGSSKDLAAIVRLAYDCPDAADVLIMYSTDASHKLL